MSDKFPRPMFSAVTEKFEDTVEAYVTCGKCGEKVRPIRLKRTRGIPWGVIQLRIWAIADHIHSCNPLNLKDTDPNASDRSVNIYHERQRKETKLGINKFPEQAVKRALLGSTPGNA